MQIAIRAVLITLSFCFVSLGAVDSEPYDPLALPDEQTVVRLDLIVQDLERNREIPLRVYLPKSDSVAPVVLFSHGLGGSSRNNPYLGNHWAAQGYVVVFMQHHGSDESVWKEAPRAERLQSMKAAASYKNAKLRYHDVSVVMDQLEIWNEEVEHPLRDRLDLERIGMSGHSFGAVTTQAVSGQKRLMGMLDYTDERIDAALAMSPSVPKGGRARSVFSEVQIPWLLMTGTKDVSMIGGADLESRLAVYPALPVGDKYELVLWAAEHSAFSERSLTGDQPKRNPNHHRAILAISTAYWDTHLAQNPNAEQWLKGEGVSGVLEAKDRWQWK